MKLVYSILLLLLFFVSVSGRFKKRREAIQQIDDEKKLSRPNYLSPYGVGIIIVAGLCVFNITQPREEGETLGSFLKSLGFKWLVASAVLAVFVYYLEESIANVADYVIPTCIFLVAVVTLFVFRSLGDRSDAGVSKKKDETFMVLVLASILIIGTMIITAGDSDFFSLGTKKLLWLLQLASFAWLVLLIGTNLNTRGAEGVYGQQGAVSISPIVPVLICAGVGSIAVMVQ